MEADFSDEINQYLKQGELKIVLNNIKRKKNFCNKCHTLYLFEYDLKRGRKSDYLVSRTKSELSNHRIFSNCILFKFT